MTVLKMEDKVQYKRHILTSGTITVESLHPMHIQLSAFFHSFLSHLHTYTYFKVALRQQNEHYIWHYEAFLVELPKALSVEKKSITRQCLIGLLLLWLIPHIKLSFVAQSEQCTDFVYLTSNVAFAKEMKEGWPNEFVRKLGFEDFEH